MQQDVVILDEALYFQDGSSSKAWVAYQATQTGRLITRYGRWDGSERFVLAGHAQPKSFSNAAEAANKKRAKGYVDFSQKMALHVSSGQVFPLADLNQTDAQPSGATPAPKREPAVSEDDLDELADHGLDIFI